MKIKSSTPTYHDIKPAPGVCPACGCDVYSEIPTAGGVVTSRIFDCGCQWSLFIGDWIHYCRAGFNYAVAQRQREAQQPRAEGAPDHVYNALSSLRDLGQYLFNKSQNTGEASTAFQVMDTARAGLEALKREREAQQPQADGAPVPDPDPVILGAEALCNSLNIWHHCDSLAGPVLSYKRDLEKLLTDYRAGREAVTVNDVLFNALDEIASGAESLFGYDQPELQMMKRARKALESVPVFHKNNIAVFFLPQSQKES